MSTTTTRKLLDESLSTIQDDILRMGSLVEEQINRAVYALREREVKMAHQVVEADNRVNELRYRLEDECLRAIATQQPAARGGQPEQHQPRRQPAGTQAPGRAHPAAARARGAAERAARGHWPQVGLPAVAGAQRPPLVLTSTRPSRPAAHTVLPSRANTACRLAVLPVG